MQVIRFVLGALAYRWPFFPVRKIIRQNLDFVNYLKVSILNLKHISWQLKYIKQEHIWVFDDWSETYFHWTFDVLVKLQVLKTKSTCNQIAVPYFLLKQSYVQESLGFLGYQITPLNGNRLFFFRHLITQQNVEYFSGQILNNIRTDIFSKIPAQAITEKIYISRKNASRRKLINEHLLTDQLEKHGFKIVCLEEFQWKQQVILFQQAVVIVGMHGAGLSNVLYCVKAALVVELLPSAATNKLFQVLSSDLGYSYKSVLLNKDNIDPHALSLALEEETIAEILTHLKLN